jgi:hypothetical protein
VFTIHLDPKPTINLTLTETNGTVFEDLTLKVHTDRDEETDRDIIATSDNNQVTLDAFPGLNYLNITRTLFGSATPSNIRPGWYDGVETYNDDTVPTNATPIFYPNPGTPPTSPGAWPKGRLPPCTYLPSPPMPRSRQARPPPAEASTRGGRARLE